MHYAVVVSTLMKNHCLHGILSTPFSCNLVMLLAIIFIEKSDFRHQWIIRYRIYHEIANVLKYTNYGIVRSLPRKTVAALTDISIIAGVTCSDIAMVNFSGEGNFGGFERVVRGKMNVEKVYASAVWRAHDDCIQNGTYRHCRDQPCNQMEGLAPSLQVHDSIFSRPCWWKWVDWR